jgi:hypothetical protein
MKKLIWLFLTIGLWAQTSSYTINILPFSVTPVFDARQGTLNKITLSGNVTSSSLAYAQAGQRFTIEVCQNGTGGFTFVWPSNVTGAPTVTSTANLCTLADFVYDGQQAIATGQPGVGGGTVTNIGVTVPSWLSVSPASINSSGTLAITVTGGQTQNQFLATPNGSSGAFGPRSIVAADLPGTINASTTGTAAALTATPSICTAGNAPRGVDTGGNAVSCQALSGATGFAGMTAGQPAIATAGTTGTSDPIYVDAGQKCTTPGVLDQSCINNAIASNTTVIAPAGTYAIASAITVSGVNHVTLDLSRAILVAQNAIATGILNITGTSTTHDIVVKGGQFNGNSVCCAGGVVQVNDANDGSFTGPARVYFYNMEMFNSTIASGLCFRAITSAPAASPVITDIYIRDSYCHDYNNAQAGIAFNKVTGGEMTGNRVHAPAGTSPCYGFTGTQSAQSRGN